MSGQDQKMSREEFLALVDELALGHLEPAVRDRCYAYLDGASEQDRAAYDAALEAALTLALTVQPVRVPDRVWDKIELSVAKEPVRSVFPIRANKQASLATKLNPGGWAWPTIAAGLALVSVSLGWKLNTERSNSLRAIEKSSSLTATLAENQLALDGCRRGLHEQMEGYKQTQDLLSFVAKPGMKMMHPQKMAEDAPSFVFMMNEKDGAAWAMGPEMAAPAGEVFELWVIPKKGRPVPAGTFDKMGAHQAVAVAHKMALSDMGGFAISREPAPGGDKPTQMLLLARL